MSEEEREILTEGSDRSGKTVHCRTCGAEYDATIPNCPYCGTMNLPAAETAYMNKLEGLRGDLKDLGNVHKTETRAHLGRLTKKVLIAAGAFLLLVAVMVIVRLAREKREASEEQAEYLWQRTGFAEMDRYYAAGDYETLTAYYEAASDEGHRVWQYAHRDFCDYYGLLMTARDSLRAMERGEGSRLFLFIDEVSLYRLEALTGLTKEERALLEEQRRPLLEDFAARFDLTDAELAEFQGMVRRDGFVSLKACERLFKERGWEE